VKLRLAINNFWGSIQKESVRDGAFEFKLRGNPWSWYEKGQECVQARRLLAGLLQCAISYGWNLVSASDITKVDGERDILFFENAKPDPDVQLVIMSLHNSDTVRLINATQTLKELLRDAVLSQWKKGIDKQRDYYGSYEIRMRGSPWYQSEFGEKSVLRTCLMCQILANFKAVGYKLYASLNISTSIEGGDLDTWVFRKV
jgi:hypothetical protein